MRQKGSVPFLLILILVIATFFVLATVSFSSFSKKTNKCFAAANIQTANTLQKAKLTTEENNRNNLLCNEGKETSLSLFECLNKIKESNGVLFYFFSKYPKFKNSVTADIPLHNQLCPQNIIEYPEFLK